ncbi:MAG: prepilin-type N-terminal cleavage/methylation domain-containing protein [Phycisphaerales bacterium]
MTRGRGFSLVEVLIGILVLALGLLGLGAIIPVVVREQRIAADTTLGAACAGDIKAWLESRPEFNAAPVPSAGGPAGHAAWDAWIRNVVWSGPFPSGSAGNAYLWEGWSNDSTEFNPDTAELVWYDDTLNLNPRFEHRLPLTERLWPSRTSQVVRSIDPGTDPYRPQFVWDLVGRRVQFGDQYARVIANPSDPGYQESIGRPDVVQVVIFVRRIDLAIRTPRTSGVTLFDVLTDAGRPAAQQQLVQADWRFPVSVTESTPRRLLQNAGPSTTPGAAYADPVYFDPPSVSYDPARPDRIRLNGVQRDDAEVILASQPGQKVVDNLGNVHTVRRLADPGVSTTRGIELLLERAVPSWVVETDSTKPRSLRQLVFVPQVPVAVEVVTITRPVAMP